jgi:uncharacterized protein
MRIRLSAIVLVLSLLTASVSAQEAKSSHNAKIRRLLELTGAASLGLQVIDSMIASFKESMPEIPDEFWAGFRAKIKPEGLIDLIVPVYEKHLAEADVDELIKFFSSPVGKRFVEKQPLILADTMQAGETWGQNLGKEVLEELKKKGYDIK